MWQHVCCLSLFEQKKIDYKLCSHRKHSIVWFFSNISVFPSFFFICFFLINTYSLCRAKTDAITSKSNLFNCWVGYAQPIERVFTKTRQPFVELNGAINANLYGLAKATNLQKRKIKWDDNCIHCYTTYID